MEPSIKQAQRPPLSREAPTKWLRGRDAAVYWHHHQPTVAEMETRAHARVLLIAGGLGSLFRAGVDLFDGRGWGEPPAFRGLGTNQPLGKVSEQRGITIHTTVSGFHVDAALMLVSHSMTTATRGHNTRVSKPSGIRLFAGVGADSWMSIAGKISLGSCTESITSHNALVPRFANNPGWDTGLSILGLQSAMDLAAEPGAIDLTGRPVAGHAKGHGPRTLCLKPVCGIDLPRQRCQAGAVRAG